MAPRLLLAGLAILAGCGGGSGAADEKPDGKLGPEAQEALDELDANTRTPDPAADVEELLGERATALEAEDGLALSATATGRQRALDRVSARRAKRLSIERVRIVADELETSGARGEALVTMSYRVRGVRRPFFTVRKLEVRKESAGWRVSRDVARAESLPWEVAAFEVTRAPHVVLLTDPGVDAAPLRDGLEQAYREIRRNLPARDLPRKRARDRRARRRAGRAPDRPDRARRRRACQRARRLRPAAGDGGRARARAAADRDRLALAHAAAGGAGVDARARDDAHGAQPRHRRGARRRG